MNAGLAKGNISYTEIKTLGYKNYKILKDISNERIKKLYGDGKDGRS